MNWNLNKMAMLKRCTEEDISVLLETSSDSNIYEFNETYISKKNIDNDSLDFDTSDNNKSLLLRTDVLQKKQTSLRLKLRRSTEQSVYKIDTESEDKRPKRLTRSMKLKNLQDENQMSHKGARAIKLPKRYSDYECDSYKSEVSILQRDQMNYNEEELFFDSLNTIDKRKQEINKHAIQIDDDSNCICINFIPKSPSTSTSKIKKQNYVYSIEDINGGNATPKIHRTKFSRYTLIGEELKKDNVDKISPKRAYPKDTTQNISLDNTSKKSRIDCKSILTISNKDESMIYKVGKSKIDRIKITGQVDKDLSMKTSQKNNTNNKKNIIKSLVMQNGLNIQRTSFKRNILTPTMKMRTNIPAKPVTLLQEVRTKLHVSAVPKSLPCREEQFNNIYTFVESKLMDKNGGCIYISGVPGTGKTATVNEIVKCLKRSVEKGQLDYFDFIEINGMKLSDPRQVYVQILKQLSGKILTWEQAHNILEKKFNSNIKRPMTLLLVDELDLLCTKRQDVIYNLLDWPTKASARLVVITIANTMDLPERVLMGRITSRLGLTRVTFQPYNYKQLHEIVLTRLKNTDILKNDIIQLIARKVSAVSGDARRALDICRRVVEITETRNDTTVSVQDVNKALSEMMINPKVQAIRHCSKFEQIFLQAISVEVKRIGVDEVCFINVYKQFESLCSFDGHKTPNITQTLDICANLGDYRLLICEYSSNDIYKKILLNISQDDMHYALQKVDLD